MSERIKLSEPGDELTMEVITATKEVIENTDYLKFSDGERELLVPASSVDRQYERLGIKGYTQMIGLIIKFSRSTKLSKYGKPFWNVDVGNESDLKPKGPSKRLTHAEASGPMIPGMDGPPVEYNDKASWPDDPYEDTVPPAHSAPKNDEAAAKRAEDRTRLIAAYKRLLSDLADHHAAVAKQHAMPTDMAAVQASVATLWITLKDKGILS